MIILALGIPKIVQVGLTQPDPTQTIYQIEENENDDRSPLNALGGIFDIGETSVNTHKGCQGLGRQSQ